MIYRIRRTSPTTYELVRVTIDAVRASAGDAAEVVEVIGMFENGDVRDAEDPHDPQSGYVAATRALGTLLTEARIAAAAGDGGTAAQGDGLLPETWTSDEGIAFSVTLPGGRDFSQCAWSWRDPAVSLVPLMLQTVNDYAHMGSELAGFVEKFSGTSTPQGSGRFYDNAAGIQFRDLLLGGRRMGVSVDPSEAIDAEEHFECTETDEEGWCVDGEWSVIFLAYEIAGVTGTPFPAMERASIILAGDAVRASAGTDDKPAWQTACVAPPRAWMMLEEPRLGEPFLDGYGEDVLVEQVGAGGEVLGLACPLMITDDGQVYGHLTYNGQCHTGNPWGPNRCASAQPSRNGYADFMTGETLCADGSRVPTGILSVGCEHSWAMDVAGVRDHLAQAGLSWARVRVSDGEHGVWVAGALRADLTEAQVSTLRGLTLSGEWVGELAGILSVNQGGLPIQRRMAASVFGGRPIPLAASSTRKRGGEVVKTIGANLVRACPECQRRAAAEAASAPEGRALKQLAREMHLVLSKMDEMLAVGKALRLRTEHLVPEAAAHARAQLSRP